MRLHARFDSSFATGAKLYFLLTFPSGRPKWDMRTTAFAPLSIAYLIVGRAATIRCGHCQQYQLACSWLIMHGTDRARERPNARRC